VAAEWFVHSVGCMVAWVAWEMDADLHLMQNFSTLR
jgi:hypothetical protein